jgi:hypothetical protein
MFVMELEPNKVRKLIRDTNNGIDPLSNYKATAQDIINSGKEYFMLDYAYVRKTGVK